MFSLVVVSSSSSSIFQGILPIAKSTFGLFYADHKFSFNGWSLPGQGIAYHDCGKTLVFGCLDVDAHNQARLDDLDVVEKVYIKLKKRTCLRAVCPTCYEKWAGKEAHKIDYRLSQWYGSGKVIHVTMSVPERLWNVPLEDLRSKVYKLAHEVGLIGGSVIIHPFRQKCKICGSPKDTFTELCLNCGCSEFLWIFSPHFHILGFGWIHGHKVAEVYNREGWITKNLGVRDSVEFTAHYQLSHSGIKNGKHTVTWFGRLAYNKMKVVSEVVEKETCPLCGSELIKVCWVGSADMPFQDEGDYFDKRENWIKGTPFIRFNP